MYTVNIFTLTTCRHCLELKDLLRENQIEFKEFDISKNHDTFNEIVKLTGHNSLPTTYLQDTETGAGPIFVPGRDYLSKEELLEKIKKYI